ncbi:MAG: HAD family hydrolase [Candidatus Bathyarchaeota archaeon]|nr:MAG: HAD family hydrolase [Candidatus Bathyarchaeota archaeon]
MNVEAVIFDLDGTLAEFNLDYKTVRAEVMELMRNHGLPDSIFSMRESIHETLKKAEIYMRNNGRIDEELLAIRKRALSIASQHEMKAARETSLLPGVLETVKTLNGMGLKLGIFTINGMRSTNFILDNLGLHQFFDAIVTREDVQEVKPDPSHLAKALKTLNTDPERTIVVGDSITDMKSAKSLGVTAVGVATSEGTKRKLNTAGATETIKSVADLPALIKELNKS